jgi:hypothetical protein
VCPKPGGDFCVVSEVEPALAQATLAVPAAVFIISGIRIYFT